MNDVTIHQTRTTHVVSRTNVGQYWKLNRLIINKFSLKLEQKHLFLLIVSGRFDTSQEDEPQRKLYNDSVFCRSSAEEKHFYYKTLVWAHFSTHILPRSLELFWSWSIWCAGHTIKWNHDRLEGRKPKNVCKYYAGEKKTVCTWCVINELKCFSLRVTELKRWSFGWRKLCRRVFGVVLRIHVAYERPETRSRGRRFNEVQHTSSPPGRRRAEPSPRGGRADITPSWRQ